MLKAVNYRRGCNPAQHRARDLRPTRSLRPLGRPSLAPATFNVSQSTLMRSSSFVAKFATAAAVAKPVQPAPQIKHRHFKRNPLHKLHSTTFKPTAEYNARLQQAIDANDQSAVVQILEDIDQKSVMFTMDTIHLIIKFATKQKNEDILDEVKGLMAVCNLRANETTYKLFIDFYTQSNDTLAIEDSRHKLQDYLFAKKHLPELVNTK